MSRQRALITGLGIVTSLGLGVKINWESALKGLNGIRPIDTEYIGSPIFAAGRVEQDSLKTIKATFPKESEEDAEVRTLFALWAASEALSDARLTPAYDNNIGISFASGLAINRLEDIASFIKDKRFDYNSFYEHYQEVHNESIMKNNSHRPAAVIADRFNLGGRNITSTSACASATQAIGIALRSVQCGETDLMLAGGADSMINPVGLVFFVLLGAAATAKDLRSCRPFDIKRSGLVMGEGAAFLVIESERSALKRGAKIYCECAGYGASMDSFQVTAPEPEGAGAYLSMLRAIENAGLALSDIDYINAHGTSTKLNDLAETKAIKRLFGEQAYRIKINSTKSLIGHLLAASGAPEAVFTALSVHNNIVHPTINLSHPDPQCDLDYSAEKASPLNIRAALSNSFGFGGQNATVAFKKFTL